MIDCGRCKSAVKKNKRIFIGQNQLSYENPLARDCNRLPKASCEAMK